MNAVENFEFRLQSLDPVRFDFLTSVDELLNSVSPEFHEKLIPAIFRFFEKYPLEDCGTPGSLVHLTERFYPRYKSILLESLARAPSYNTIWMTNRILNSQLVQGERDEYMAALESVSSNPDNHQVLVEWAQEFIEHRNRKHGQSVR